jgi:hypothetical protein
MPTQEAIPAGAQIGDAIPTDAQVGDAIPAGAQIGTQPQSMLQKVGSVASDYAHQAGGAVSDLTQGIGEGALDTIHGTGELIRKGGNFIHAGLGDTVVPPVGQAALNQIATASDTTQKVGKGLESAAEFFLGDEALKGLSLAERAGLLSKVAKMAEAHPVIANILDKGLRAFTVSTGQELLHGQTPSQALETGATTGVVSGGLSGLSDLVSSTFQPIEKGLANGIDMMAKKAKPMSLATKEFLANPIAPIDVLESGNWDFPTWKPDFSKTGAAGELTQEELEQAKNQIATKEGRQAAARWVSPQTPWDKFFTEDLVTPIKDVAVKFGTRVAVTAATTYALDRTMEHMGIKPEQRHLIDVMLGAGGIGLGGKVFHSLDVMNSPEGKAMGAKIAAGIVNHPEVIDAGRAAVNRLLSYAASQMTHVYDPATATANPTSDKHPQ